MSPFGSTVTILFTDISGFTEYTDRYGDEKAYRMLQSHNAVVEQKVQLLRGYIVKTLSYMVAYDSARNAVMCAVEIQRALGAFGLRDGTAHRWPDRTLELPGLGRAATQGLRRTMIGF